MPPLASADDCDDAKRARIDLLVAVPHNADVSHPLPKSCYNRDRANKNM
jgi:hypothetical protein